MNAIDYKRERKLRGSQTEVAAQLDVRQATVSDRETGAQPITKEAWLALLSLPKKHKKFLSAVKKDLRRKNLNPNAKALAEYILGKNEV